MVQTAIFTLTSELHDEQAVDAVTKDFLGSLGIDHLFKGSDYSDYGSHTLNLIFVRTGGTPDLCKDWWDGRHFQSVAPQITGEIRPSLLLVDFREEQFTCCIDGDSLLSPTESSQWGDHSWQP